MHQSPKLSTPRSFFDPFKAPLLLSALLLISAALVPQQVFLKAYSVSLRQGFDEGFHLKD